MASDVKINMTSPKQTAVTAAFQRPCEYGGRTKRMPLLHLCGIVIRFLKRQLLGVFGGRKREQTYQMGISS